MRCSKWFNARQTRAVRDFCVSHGPQGLFGLLLLADRAENSESQATLGRSGRRQHDHFAIEMSEAEARKLYEALHRKFGKRKGEEEEASHVTPSGLATAWAAAQQGQSSRDSLYRFITSNETNPKR